MPKRIGMTSRKAGSGRSAAGTAQIVAGVEAQFIMAACEFRAFQQGPVGTAVGIGADRLEIDRPAVEHVKLDLQTRRGLSRGRVENMRRQTPHRAS